MARFRRKAKIYKLVKPERIGLISRRGLKLGRVYQRLGKKKGGYALIGHGKTKKIRNLKHTTRLDRPL